MSFCWTSTWRLKAGINTLLRSAIELYWRARWLSTKDQEDSSWVTDICIICRVNDTGILSYKDHLPVREIIIGDTHRPGSEAVYNIGPLRCYGDSKWSVFLFILFDEWDPHKFVPRKTLGCGPASLILPSFKLILLYFNLFYSNLFFCHLDYFCCEIKVNRRYPKPWQCIPPLLCK